MLFLAHTVKVPSHNSCMCVASKGMNYHCWFCCPLVKCSGAVINSGWGRSWEGWAGLAGLWFRRSSKPVWQRLPECSCLSLHSSLWSPCREDQHISANYITIAVCNHVWSGLYNYPNTLGPTSVQIMPKPIIDNKAMNIIMNIINFCQTMLFTFVVSKPVRYQNWTICGKGLAEPFGLAIKTEPFVVKGSYQNWPLLVISLHQQGGHTCCRLGPWQLPGTHYSITDRMAARHRQR